MICWLLFRVFACFRVIYPYRYTETSLYIESVYESGFYPLGCHTRIRDDNAPYWVQEPNSWGCWNRIRLTWKPNTSEPKPEINRTVCQWEANGDRTKAGQEPNSNRILTELKRYPPSILIPSPISSPGL